jgi:hypothetical protein
MTEIGLMKGFAAQITSGYWDHPGMARDGGAADCTLITRSGHDYDAPLRSMIEGPHQLRVGRRAHQGEAQVQNAGTRLEALKNRGSEFVGLGTWQLYIARSRFGKNGTHEEGAAWADGRSRRAPSGG